MVPVLASVMINTRQAEAIMNNDFFITVNVFVVVEFLFVVNYLQPGPPKAHLSVFVVERGFTLSSVHELRLAAVINVRARM